MKVCVIIVTHNPRQWLQTCLKSIRSSHFELTPILVDNHSTDGSTEIIKKNYPEFHLIELQKNKGFAHANNIGLKKALKEDFDYFFLLNQDAWIEPDTITKLVDTAENHPEYGVLSPIHFNGSGNLLDWNFTRWISNPDDEGRDYYSDLIREKNLKPVYKINFVNAAAWLISRECLNRVGFFDDQLFRHYDEDRNYLQRVQYHHLKTGIVPGSIIYHDREERNGEKIKNELSISTALSSFILSGSNILNKNAVKWMENELSIELKRMVKELVFLNGRKSLQAWNRYRQKKKFLPLIRKRREHYQISQQVARVSQPRAVNV